MCVCVCHDELDRKFDSISKYWLVFDATAVPQLIKTFLAQLVAWLLIDKTKDRKINTFSGHYTSFSLLVFF